jgi:hypothetical protein
MRSGNKQANIFGLMEAKVHQLEQAVLEFNQALTTTSLQPYFGNVGVKLHKISQNANKRLSEVPPSTTGWYATGGPTFVALPLHMPY